jgi:GNAT superfamily N-acetyltransferase
MRKTDLDLLVTDPAFQRRGAAALLLDKLGEIADEAGQQIFLVSTDAARIVYEKALFAPVREVVLDLTHFGEAEGRERFTVSEVNNDHLRDANLLLFMIRQPSKKK